MTDLQVRNKSWYESDNLSDEEYNNYKVRQIKIHDKKVHYERGMDEYTICANHMLDYIKEQGKMLCLGTRNEYEKEVFKKLLSAKNVEVFSQDIAELAGADYTCDFSELSRYVSSGWDIMFSNSLDHALDATATVNDWLTLINPEGLLILGFCFDPRSASDVCVFTEDGVNAFVNEHPQLSIINHYKSGAFWDYWTIRKVGQ